MSREKDIVEDIFFRVKEVLGHEFKGQIVLKLEQEEQRIRMDWGGTESYIQKKKINDKTKQKAREFLAKGVPVKEVSKQTGLKENWLYVQLRRKY